MRAGDQEHIRSMLRRVQGVCSGKRKKPPLPPYVLYSAPCAVVAGLVAISLTAGWPLALVVLGICSVLIILCAIRG